MLAAGNIYVDLIAPFMRRRSKRSEKCASSSSRATDLADKIHVSEKRYEKGYLLSKRTTKRLFVGQKNQRSKIVKKLGIIENIL